jgi:hypothetical protein
MARTPATARPPTQTATRHDDHEDEAFEGRGPWGQRCYEQGRRRESRIRIAWGGLNLLPHTLSGLYSQLPAYSVTPEGGRIPNWCPAAVLQTDVG